MTLRKGAIAPWAKSSSPYYMPDADRARQDLQVHARHQVEGPAEESAGRMLHGSGDGRDQVLL
jgi:hypothetical protein